MSGTAMSPFTRARRWRNWALLMAVVPQPLDCFLQLPQLLLQFDDLAQLDAQLQERARRPQADGLALGLQQLPQRVGGLGHAVRHLAQRPLDHLAPQLADAAAEVGVG